MLSTAKLFAFFLGTSTLLISVLLLIQRAEAPVSGWYLYESNASGNRDIYRTRLDDSNGLRMTTDPHFDLMPSWSPDGGRIVFVSNRSGSWDIYLMTAYGHERQRLTDHDADDYQPTWSPDGEWIVFVSTRDGNANIYRMRADGTDPYPLTRAPSEDDAPSWSEDGEWINYVSWSGGNRRIYTMRPDGSEVQISTLDRQGFYFYSPRADTTPISPLVDLNWRPWLLIGLASLMIGHNQIGGIRLGR